MNETNTATKDIVLANWEKLHPLIGQPPKWYNKGVEFYLGKGGGYPHYLQLPLWLVLLVASLLVASFVVGWLCNSTWKGRKE